MERLVKHGGIRTVFHYSMRVRLRVLDLQRPLMVMHGYGHRTWPCGHVDMYNNSTMGTVK
jgi:hypothetical protein